MKTKQNIARKLSRVVLLSTLVLSSATPISAAFAETPTKPKAAQTEKKPEKKPENSNSEAAKKALNDYIWGLQYDKLNILTHQGEKLKNHSSREAFHRPGEYVVIEKKKQSISNATSKLSVSSANDDRIFPGALLKADQSLLENLPTLIPVNRGKTTISVNLPGLKNGESNLTVENPSNSTVRTAVNNLVEKWIQKYSKTHAVPARMQYESISAQSMSQLQAKFGADFSKVGAPLNVDFSSVHKGEKQVFIANFRQVYYTASVDSPNSPSALFGSGITPTDLINRGVNSKTPPVYVSNVSYGRAMYVKFETTSKSTKVQAAIDAVVKGAKLKAGTEYENILKNTKITAVVLGGNPGEASKVITGNIDTLKDLIQKGSNFSAQSPAVPISYTTSFVKDNSIATIQNNTDYIETKVTSYKDGALTLNHDGAFVARFYVYWEELGHDADGYETIRSRSWSGNGYNRGAHYSTTLRFKGNVRNIRVKVLGATGLAWEPWRLIYSKNDLPLVPQRNISTWGTTLHPQFEDKVVKDNTD